MRWIKTETKKPDNLERILMSFNQDVYEGVFINNKFYFEVVGDITDEQQEEIKYWMALPRPPSPTRKYAERISYRRIMKSTINKYKKKKK